MAGVEVAMNASVKSATRVFEILEFFRETQRPLRLSDIAERFGYPPSSVSGLLKTMTAQGYLVFEPTKRTYFPTAKLLQLVNWIPDFEEGAVIGAMKSLQQSTGEMIVLGTMVDIFVVYIEVLRSTQSVQVWSPPGTKRLLIANGMGHLLLAQLGGAETKTSLSPQVARIYQRTVALGLVKAEEFSSRDLAHKLHEIGGQDFLFTRSSGDSDSFTRRRAESAIGPGNPGGGMISMLLPVPPNHRPLTLGIAGPAERLLAQQDFIVVQMRQQIEHLAQLVDAERKI